MQILLQEATSENAIELHESIIKFNKNPYLFIENYRQGFSANDIAHYLSNKKYNGMQYCIRDEIDSRLLGFINMSNIDYKSRKAKIYLTAFSVKECIIAMAQVIDILKRYKNVSKLYTQLLSSE
jgi:RimJ/RimL family protein N-acetyltransferase